MEMLVRWRRRNPLFACAAICATVLTLIALGHDGGRIAQVASLALPVFAWLLWPVESTSVHRLRTGIVWLWAMAFVADGALRAYLLDAYAAAPDGAMVIGAAANTNAREGGEYLSANRHTIALWLAVIVGAAMVVGWYAPRGVRAVPGGAASSTTTLSAWPRWSIALLCALLLAAVAAYANKPSRRLHPLIFWTQWTRAVELRRAGWSDQLQARERSLARARALAPVVALEGPSTVMLVIGESINRDNMALYGYGRATSPGMQAQQAQLGDQLLVLRNAWSVDASTVPAMHNIFNFGTPPMEDPQHLLALARAGGYKVWWISNQDDVAIEQQHARMANVVDMINRKPGRASASLDSEILDDVQEALADKSERKLIVVHLMGAHPHYGLRFPTGENPFDDRPDAVDAAMVRLGRSAWVRHTREEYDAAVLYHDFVVSELLRMTRTSGTSGTSGSSTGGNAALPHDLAWMYLSDHAQEVGHVSDRAGHSPTTASGYRIPAIVWRNHEPGPVPPGLGTEPFRADWAGWTIADLLHLKWPGDQPQRDVLNPDYRWQAPALPIAAQSFKD